MRLAIAGVRVAALIELGVAQSARQFLPALRAASSVQKDVKQQGRNIKRTCYHLPSARRYAASSSGCRGNATRRRQRRRQRPAAANRRRRRRQRRRRRRRLRRLRRLRHRRLRRRRQRHRRRRLCRRLRRRQHRRRRRLRRLRRRLHRRRRRRRQIFDSRQDTRGFRGRCRAASPRDEGAGCPSGSTFAPLED